MKKKVQKKSGKNASKKQKMRPLTPALSQRERGKNAVPLQPLNDRVVVQITEREEMTAGGIYIPETAREEKPEEGVVVAVGPGKWDEDGERRILVSVSVGDKILFSKYGPDEVMIKGTKYLVIREDSILAVIK